MSGSRRRNPVATGAIGILVIAAVAIDQWIRKVRS